MDFDEVLGVISALDSETRLRYLVLLSEQKLSTRELQELYNSRYSESIRRESVHRGIEDLREVGILTRSYDEKQNYFKYGLATNRVVVEVEDGEIRIQ